MFRLAFALLFVLLSLLPTEAFAQFLKVGVFFVKVETVQVKTNDGTTITLTKGDRLLVTPVRNNQQYFLLGMADREITIDTAQLISSGEALEYFNDAIRKKPTARNYIARGKTYRYPQGRDKPAEPNKALADINQAIRLEPKLAEAYFWRAESNWGDQDNAIADYTKAIDLDPKFAMAYFRRAMRRDQEMEPDKIVADYVRVMALDPTWNEVWRNYLQYWADLSLWLDEEPQLEMRTVNASLAFFDKQIKRSPELLAKTIKYSRDEKRPLAPHILGLYMRRGKLMEHNANYEKAIADYSRIIELEAKSRPRSARDLANSYRRRAWILATCPDDKIRDGGKAVHDATKAYQLINKKDYESLETIAAANAEHGEFDKAIEWQQQVLKLTNKSIGGQRLAYYQDKKPYREQAGEDLTKYGQIPKDLHKKTPQQLLQQFYDHLAVGKIEHAMQLVAPEQDKRHREGVFRFFSRTSEGIENDEFSFEVVATKEHEGRSLAVVRFIAKTKKPADPKRIKYRGVFLQKRIVGWMLSPERDLPFGDASLPYDADPLHEWFNEQQAKLSGKPLPSRLVKKGDDKPLGRGADPDGWGSLRGRFVYDGDPPKRIALRVAPNHLRNFGIDEVLDESVVVSKEGGLANVVVLLRNKPKRIHPSYDKTARATVRFESVGAVFRPHVIALRSSQTLELRNTSALGANFNASHITTNGFNVILATGQVTRHKFREAVPSPFMVQSNVYPWMRAWMVVVEHPYFAVTAANGSFEIANLPAGEWEFQVWHEFANGRGGGLEVGNWKRGRFVLRVPDKNAIDFGTIEVPPKALSR